METKKAAADSSVVMALSELVRMEQDRMESDREREAERARQAREDHERAEAAARDAEQKRSERAAQQARVAEAEARLRLEADREQAQRVAAMRAELARVEAERQTLRANLEARLAPPEPARANGWALAFGLSSLVAASLAGLLVMQQGTQSAILPTTTSAARPAIVAAVPAAPEVAPAVVQTARTEQAEAPVVRAPAPVTGRGHRHRDRDHVDSTTSHGADIIGLGDDDGGDDVLGPDLVREAHSTLRH